MHGQFPHSLDEKLVDKEQSNRWLKFGIIKGEIESTTVTAQDQAIGTNYFKIGFTRRPRSPGTVPGFIFMSQEKSFPGMSTVFVNSPERPWFL
jgi:hypothetical protein